MKAWFKWREQWRAGLVSAVLTVLAGWCFLSFQFGDPLAHLSYELPFAVRRDITPEEVLLVYMDEESHRVLGQPRFDVWDRSLHAQLLGRLQAAGAKAVVFDILFDLPSTNNPAADEALVQAARASGRVAVAGVVGNVIFNRQSVGTEPVRPFPALEAAVATWGMVEISDGERIIREHYRGSFGVPSMVWRAMAMTTSNVPPPNAPRWMNYYGPSGTIPHESYHRVLSNAVPQEVISNKVVFVGALFSVGWTGGRGSDDFRIPYTRWSRGPDGRRLSPGVEVNATAYLNLVRRDWLTRTPPWLEFALMLLFGFPAGYLLGRMRPLPALGMAALVSLVVGGLACFVMWQYLLWFPWLVLVLAQLPVAVLCSIGWALRHLQRTREELDAALAHAASAAERAMPTPDMVSSEVLQQMLRLRGTSGVSPNLLAVPPRVPVQAPVIHDHQLLQSVGKGGYGEVWLAVNVTGRYRAAKVIQRSSFKESRPYEREFEGICKFEPISRSHPGLVQVLHVGRDAADQYYYYVMEAADDVARGQSIVPGSYSPKTLSTVITQHGRLDAQECLRLALSMTQALEFLHERGLIHRDIKPSNIIFVNGEPKLADIGLVTDIGRDKTFVGTAGYFPPEGPGTPSADLYSLGKVLYELCTGFDRSRYPELPTTFNEQGHAKALAAFNDIILKACDAEPSRRYQRAAELRADLESALRQKKGWF